MPLERRRFLQSAAALAAAAQGGTAAPAPTLPTVKLGRYDITRLIIGSNPFYGYSHFNRILDETMREWYTTERVLDVLRQCEQAGVTTWQLSYRQRALEDVKRHRETGGRLQWLLLSSNEMTPDDIPKIAAMKPIGIVHHGGITDRLFSQGQHDKVRDFLKRVRDSGVMVGMSTHRPHNLERVESENWDVDFYMTCCYQLTRSPEEIKKIAGELVLPASEVYLEGDPARMLRVVRQVKKTCLAFKILAAGRVSTPPLIDKAFEFAFANIKPQDAVIVGLYPRYSDQVRENAARVRKILSAT